MPADPCLRLGTAALRTRMAAQLFKRALLGDRHTGGGIQAERVSHAVSAAGVDEGQWVTQGTWSNWCHGRGVAQHASLARFDATAQALTEWHRPCDGAKMRWPDAFFSEMARGGLLRSLCGVVERGEVDSASWAAEYRHLSAWHLHLDALEAAAFADSARTSSLSVKSLMAHAVLAVIDRLWGQRHGLIYQNLSGGEAVAGQPTCGAQPNWSVIRAGSDSAPQHASVTMLALLADPALLSGDRLVAWSWDLATVTLATQAWLWCDRDYVFKVSPVPSTLVAWLGLVQLFYMANDDEIDTHALAASVEQAGVGWTDEVDRLLFTARENYWGELSALGIHSHDIQQIRLAGEEAQPSRTIG